MVYVEGKVRKMFPGGNTSLGFYSYYRYIIPEDARRIFVIKGGPGVGKSSFMKKIAGEMISLGHDVEMHYCSSDYDSLDGVVIPDKNVALIDGTSPHVVDPKNPGCVDEILHLGDYWDTDAMEKNKSEILINTKKVGKHFARAYKFLASAKEIMDDIEDITTAAMHFGKINIMTEKLSKELMGSMAVCDCPGKERHLFGSAYTPGGFVDYSDTVLNKAGRVYFIEGRPGTGKTSMLNRLAMHAVERGLTVEYFHAPLKPQKLDSIVVKELGLAVTCSSKGKDYADRIIDLNEYLDESYIDEAAELIKKDYKAFDLLLEEALGSILAAKTVHDELETYYVPNMDFEGVNRLRERTAERILGYS